MKSERHESLRQCVDSFVISRFALAERCIKANWLRLVQLCSFVEKEDYAMSGCEFPYTETWDQLENETSRRPFVITLLYQDTEWGR